MKMYDSVTLICGQYSESPAAVRAVLELFRLRVQMHVGVWRQHLTEIFAGKVPCSEYIVIMTFGEGDTENEDLDPEDMKMGFPCVELQDDWQATTFHLTPTNIPQVVVWPGKKVLFCGCGSGRRLFAQAFLQAGCESYIGCVGEVDSDAGIMFVLSYFYHLLSEDRGDTPVSDRQAFQRAAAFDAQSASGTSRFRYFAKDDLTS